MLSLFLFILILDIITEKIKEETLLARLFADGLVLSDTCKEKMEEQLEKWGSGLE